MFRYLAIAAVVMGCFIESSRAQDKQENKPSTAPALPACPIMGGQIDLSIKTDTADGPVYFCCKGCIAKYLKEPDKYTDATKAQREALARRPRVQVTCPMSGKPVDGKTSAEVNGVKVLFCCTGCLDKYKAEADKLAGKLACCFTYQTRCPVSDKEISPAAFIVLPTGQQVFFCCKDCIRKFTTQPTEYVDRLAAQGVRVDPRQIGEKR